MFIRKEGIVSCVTIRIRLRSGTVLPHTTPLSTEGDPDGQIIRSSARDDIFHL